MLPHCVAMEICETGSQFSIESGRAVFSNMVALLLHVYCHLEDLIQFLIGWKFVAAILDEMRLSD